MISWFCLIEYMQQNFEHSGLPTLSSRDPVHITYAIRAGVLPSLGRRTLGNGRVGRRGSRSICIPVITLANRP